MVLRYDFTSLEALVTYLRQTPPQRLSHQFRTLPLATQQLCIAVERVSFKLLHSKAYCRALGTNCKNLTPAEKNIGRLAAYLALTSHLSFPPL